MTLKDILTSAATMAKDVKETAVAAGTVPNRDTDLRPALFGFRGEEPVAFLMPMDGEREGIVRAGFIMAVYFGCDTISMANDTWRSSDLTNPVTGQPWGHGEMEGVVVNHQGLEKGWIVENVVTMAVNRAGDLAGQFRPYKIHERGDHYEIEWLEDEFDSTEEGASMGGYLTDKFVQFMGLESLDVAMIKNGMTAADFGLSYEQGRAHADCAVVKNLRSFGFEGGVMLLSDTKERSEVIEESLGQHVWHPGQNSTT